MKNIGRREQREAHSRSARSASASFATMPAPSHAPSTAAAIIEISVTTSTGITDDEEERLDDCGQRMADVQRAGDDRGPARA